MRDLLLQREPKDFDIATSARPQQVKRTFPRNCRIIGRRFKLAHLHFNRNQKILEVATFRRTPELGDDGEDLLITRDNVFGNAEEDAMRRDFTVNALFFDPVGDQIIDYVDGLSDLRAKILKTIGDPVTRFREDPVRILRAAKFSGRLGFDFDKPTLAAMKDVAPDLARSAPPRLLEEILRLLRGGHSLDSFQILRDIDAIEVMLPVLGGYLREADAEERVRFWRILEALDDRVVQHGAPPSPVLLGAIFTRAIALRTSQTKRRSATPIAEELLGPFTRDLRLSRRDAGCLKRICGVQQRFTARGKTRFKTSSFLRDPYFNEALDLFELTCAATGTGFDDLKRWSELAASVAKETTPDREPAARTSGDSPRSPDGDQPRRKRRRRRGRRRSGDSRSEEESATEREQDSQPQETESSGEGRRSRRPRGRGSRETPAEASSDRDSSQAPAQKKTRSRRRKASSSSSDSDQKKTDRKKAGKKAASKKTPAKKKSRSRSRRSDPVKTLEPEGVDLTAFDIELNPRQVPSFGSIVETPGSKRKRVSPPPNEEADNYKPPKPSDSTPDAPPPADDDDVFGDW